MDIGKIKAVLDYKGWKFFEEGFYNLNLIGVRSETRQAGKFDDTLVVAYKDPIHGEVVASLPMTADAGLHWLTHPFVSEGTAVLLPNQYRGAYKLGIHGRSWKSGGYEALEQQGEMLYIRDGNRDGVINLPNFSIKDDPERELIQQGKTIYRGNLKTNIHRAAPYAKSLLVGRASAGCQVLQDPKDFAWLIDLVKESISNGWRNSFTYTLIHESWLSEV